MTTYLAELLGPGVSDNDVSKWLAKNYKDNPEEQWRRANMRQRLDLYRDRGERILSELLEVVFNDEKVKEYRRRFLRWAKHNNLTKRVINEVATVYSKPAKRTVAASEQEAYDAVLAETHFDQKMKKANRYMELCRQILIGFRVRARDKRSVVDIVTPDNFYAVSHPDDPTELIAVIIDQHSTFNNNRDPEAKEAHYIVWTERDSFKLTQEFIIMEETTTPHTMERIPYILASVEPPDEGLLDMTEGDDLTAAHVSVWFQNILALKESKSAGKQTYFQGDTSQIATDQSGDTEEDVLLPDGVQPGTLDRGVDISQFQSQGDHILEGAAANRGIPPSVLRHQGATSGFEITLRRLSINERRDEQIDVMRQVERELAGFMSFVVGRELPAEREFSVETWEIDYSETMVPVDPEKKLSIFENRKRNGLTSTLAFMMKENPDLTLERAKQLLAQHIAEEELKVALMQELMRMNGSMVSEPTDNTPEQNGQLGRDAQRGGDDSADEATAA